MRTIAIVNQKGGCGKTTSVVNLAGCLAADGARVLVVDMDPQAHATLALGIDPDALEENLFDVLVDPGTPVPIDRIVLGVADGIDLAPSGIVLSALEQKLVAEQAEDRTERLASALASAQEAYDYALIDCPPNVGLLTFNALRAAREVIVPLETSFFAIQSVQKLLETIGLLSDRIAHDLSVRILPTLFDARTRYSRDTLAEIRDLFKELCFDTVIRQNVKLREAARRGAPLVSFARTANGALDYSALAVEVAAESVEDELDAPALGADTAVEPPRQVIVQFRNAEARDVRIAGDFNGWVPDKGVQTRREKAGGEQVWTKILELPPGTYQYRYVVDGDWREDPSNPEKAPGRVGERNSLLVVR
ncbi:MAG: AAA family ATPase [Deltaproteobacteria bacterium]|nr:AAA family ATPase [Deltaproteobacteria bacterium]MBW2445720.1 AAA family ATPase [Deltaproteobacteria bacterium]